MGAPQPSGQGTGCHFGRRSNSYGISKSFGKGTKRASFSEEKCVRLNLDITKVEIWLFQFRL